MPLTAHLAFTYTPNNHRWISGMFYSSSIYSLLWPGVIHNFSLFLRSDN